MRNIINIADCAPQRRPKLLEIAEWIIDQQFMPSLRARLQVETQNTGEIYLDFGELENVNRAHEIVMERIINLLLELEILQRVTFVNLPYAFYDYLRKICSEKAIITVHFESK